MMYKAVNDLLPCPIRSSLTISNSYFFFESPRLKQTERSISFAAPKLWNTLPNELVIESNYNVFKKNLKTYYMYK